MVPCQKEIIMTPSPANSAAHQILFLLESALKPILKYPFLWRLHSVKNKICFRICETWVQILILPFTYPEISCNLRNFSKP